jgi:membrane associated rhomboid family serine protease
MGVPEEAPRDRLREAFSEPVKAVQQGSPPTHFVAVGGGAEVAAALGEAAPRVEPVRLGFHHVDARGQVAQVKGSPLPLLDRAAARVDESAPLDPQPLADALARGQQLVQQERAAAAKLSGRYRVTVAIMIACVALAALGYVWSDGAYNLALWRMGANRGAAVKAGEIHRLLASAFLHAGGIHLAVNMLALWSFGPMLEAILGPRRYVLLYTASALGGALASAFLGGDRSSVGASGAIWGLMAAGIGLAMRPKGVLPPLMATSLRSRAWGPLVINVVYSLQPGVDMLAHLGGGVVGFALMATVLTEGLVPIDQRETAFDAERGPRPLVTAGAAIAVAAMALSVAAALITGRPWEIGGPVTMQRAPIGDTGLSLEVPSALAANAKSEKADTVRLYSFGSLIDAPVAFEVIVIPRADEIPSQQVDELLEAERPELDKLSPSKDWVLKQAARRVTLGSRPALRIDHDVHETHVQTYLTVAAGREVLVRGYARNSRPKSWEGLEEKVAASLAAP